MIRKVLIHIFLFALVPFLSAAQESGEEAIVKTDTLRRDKKIQIVGLPVAFYTPETEFGFGGGGQLFLLGEQARFNNRISNVLITAIYTTNEQLVFEALPEIYLGKGNYFIDASYRFAIFPNSFWGIGPNTAEEDEEIYNETSHILEANFLKRLPPNLNFGFTFRFANHQVTEVEEGGQLDSGLILGSDRAVIAGFGAIFNLDDRDDVGSATSGNFLSFSARYSSKLLGATQGFNTFILDLRTYRPIGKKSVFAAQLYLENHFGEVPFQGQAAFGGSKGARGYFKGRFIDKHMYVLQGEYRYRFHPRWAVNGFGLFGSVNNEVKELYRFENLKPSLGGGIRFKILKDKSTWVRLDYGAGKGGQSGIYFGVNEVF
ncbi:MAG: BamA/TamA family outer membrane protein [Flavobacteriaceae bacterium]